MFTPYTISVFKQQLQYPQNGTGNPMYDIVCYSQLTACTIAKFFFFVFFSFATQVSWIYRQLFKQAAIKRFACFTSVEKLLTWLGFLQCAFVTTGGGLRWLSKLLAIFNMVEKKRKGKKEKEKKVQEVGKTLQLGRLHQIRITPVQPFENGR